MKNKYFTVIRVVILIAGIALCVLGILRGELSEIMHKGSVICLECIGIG